MVLLGGREIAPLKKTASVALNRVRQGQCVGRVIITRATPSYCMAFYADALVSSRLLLLNRVVIYRRCNPAYEVIELPSVQKRLTTPTPPPPNV